MKVIKSIVNWTILPPLKFVAIIIALVPILWLIYAGKGEFGTKILDFITNFTFK